MLTHPVMSTVARGRQRTACSPLSTISAFISVVLLNRNRHRTWVAICHAYVDASGSPDDPLAQSFVLAGFLATESQWNRFEREWTRVLTAEGVTALHMREFAHFRGEFRAWRGAEDRRANFLQALGTVIKRHVRRSFSVGVRLADYRAVASTYQLAEQGPSLYAICAGLIARDIRQWLTQRHLEDPTLLVFERGDTGQDEWRLIHEMKMWTDWSGSEPFFIPKIKRDVGRQPVYLRPFEACDYLAFELAKALQVLDVDLAVRRSLLPLGRIPHGHGWRLVTEADLQRMCEDWHIPRR
jgi:hypothetical protein